MRSLVNNLKHRIELMAYTSTEVDGFPMQDWATFSAVWAEKIPVSERERFAAAAVQKENTIRWRIRWRKRYVDSSGKTIDWQDCRVKDLETGKLYNITGEDDGGGRKELILIAEEVTS